MPDSDYTPPPLPPEVIEKRSPRGLVPSFEHADLDLPYVAFLDKIDPRNKAETQEMLGVSTDKRFREFLRVVTTPRYKSMSLATVAKRLDISLPEMAEWYRKANHTKAMAAAAEGLTSMTMDMLSDAKSQTEMCEKCDALGWVYAAARLDPPPPGYRFMGMVMRDEAEVEQWARECPACLGKTRLAKPGDSHARDKILQMTGFTNNKGGGVTVAINNYGGLGIEAAASRMDAVTFEVGEMDTLPVDTMDTEEGDGQ